VIQSLTFATTLNVRCIPHDIHSHTSLSDVLGYLASVTFSGRRTIYWQLARSPNKEVDRSWFFLELDPVY
jgi:hypothetical protein